MDIKTIICFKKAGNIAPTLVKWASETNFKPCPKLSTQGLVDENNVSYCFYKTSAMQTTFITLHQLDETMRLEAWISKSVVCDKAAMQSVNRLLDLLGWQQNK